MRAAAPLLQEAIAILERHNTLGVRVDHSFQTNGTLIDAEWCAFIKSHNVRIGVSVDGPAFLHDRFRRTRGGKGTHTRVIQGMELLRSEGIPFHVITVLTGASLDYPDELYEFYRQYGISSVGFNVEEIEGPHRHSSLEGSATYERRGPVLRPLLRPGKGRLAPACAGTARSDRDDLRRGRRNAGPQPRDCAVGHYQRRLRGTVQLLLARAARA